MPFEVVDQGNSADPVLWLIMSIILVCFLHTLNLVTEHCTPISELVFSLATLACVDNSDLNVLNLYKKSTINAVEEAQALLSAWYFTLRALGGDLNLEKSF